MIPLSRPDVGLLEQAYVADAVATADLSSGAYVERFESAWAARCHTAHAIAVSNGTTALVLALRALGVGSGDEVLVPAFTFAGVAAAVVEAGAVPRFVDVDISTWCIDPSSAAASLSPRTVGIIAVHSYGQPAPMAALRHLAGRRALWLLEDGAEAHLATVAGRPVGGLGDLAAFSFFGNKILAAGEGGAVTTNDIDLAVRVRTLANQGVAPGAPNRYRPAVVGGNGRLSNVTCALLVAQVERADVLLEHRRAVERAYRELLPELDWPAARAGSRSVPWLCSAVTPVGVDRDRLLDDLAADGIQARPTFPAIPDLAPFHAAVDVPTTRWLATRGISLPTYSGLRHEEVEHVADRLRARIRPARRLVALP